MLSYKYVRICSLSLLPYKIQQYVVEDQSTAQVIYPPETTFLQFVGDSTDHNINTINGKKYASWSWINHVC